MEWIKIPTDSILYSEFSDAELVCLVKYQALYCQLEKQPSEQQLNRVFNVKQIKFIQSNLEVVQELCQSQVEKIIHKRNKEKENYKQKQSVSKKTVHGKNANRTQTTSTDKIREYKNNNNKLLFQKDKFNFDFVDADFKDPFFEWLEYKKARRESYKTQKSLELCYKKLLEASGRDKAKAHEVIEFSIARNYQGFFAMPPPKNNNQTRLNQEGIPY